MEEYGLLEYGGIGILCLILLLIVRSLWKGYQSKDKEHDQVLLDRIRRMEDRIATLENELSRKDERICSLEKAQQRKDKQVSYLHSWVYRLMPKTKKTRDEFEDGWSKLIEE